MVVVEELALTPNLRTAGVDELVALVEADPDLHTSLWTNPRVRAADVPPVYVPPSR
jgi:hypothetical protein